MEIMDYILENALVLAPALYILGRFLKAVPRVPDWCIPFLLLALGELGAMGIMGPCAEAAIQGVLVTGAAVLVDQGIKQAGKGMEGEG